jgi:8-oxo-dGTP diphosphatase
MNRQAIGVGVIVVRGGDILFGLRRGARTAPTPGRSPAATSTAMSGPRRARELSEETGLAAVDPRVVAETNDDFPEGLRYRTLFVRVNWSGGEPLVREPEACERWGWFVWDEPLEPLFLPVANLRDTGFRP